MPGLLERLRLLSWSPKRAQLAAIDAALQVASAPERVTLIDELAASAQKRLPVETLEILCRQWARDDAPELRVQIIERLRNADRSALESVLGDLLSRGDSESRLAGIGIIGRLPATALAERIVPMLADPELGDGAELALSEMTRWLIEGKQHGRAIAPGLVGSALLAAAEQIRSHRRAAILTDLARLVEARFRLPQLDGRPDQLCTWIKDADHPAVAALRRVLRTGEASGLGAGAWVWLKSPVLGAAAFDQFISPEGEGALPALLRPQLAQNPQRQATLAKYLNQKTSIPPALLPDADAVRALAPAARRGYAAWSLRFPAPAKLRDAAIGSLLTDPDPGVRHAAVRAAIALDGRAPSLLDLCFDTDARVARSAALSVACRDRRGLTADGALDRVLAELSRSQHPCLAAIGQGLGDHPDHPEVRLRLARALDTDRAKLVAKLTRDITADPARAVLAITTARRLRLVGDLQPVFASLVTGELAQPHSSDLRHRIACSACSALGELRDAATGDVLAAALRAASSRLRANAADALHRRMRRSGERPESVIPEIRAMCEDPEHRPRASAARVLLGGAIVPAARMASVRDAGERTLLSMLEDRRPMHRVAGLWLAERAASRVSPLPEIVDAVASLARLAKGEERTRARLAAERLIIEVRTGWASRAQPMALEGADAEEAVA